MLGDEVAVGAHLHGDGVEAGAAQVQSALNRWFDRRGHVDIELRRPAGHGGDGRRQRVDQLVDGGAVLPVDELGQLAAILDRQVHDDAELGVVLVPRPGPGRRRLGVRGRRARRRRLGLRGRRSGPGAWRRGGRGGGGQIQGFDVTFEGERRSPATVGGDREALLDQHQVDVARHRGPGGHRGDVERHGRREHTGGDGTDEERPHQRSAARSNCMTTSCSGRRRKPSDS